jgi:hypothetical protein
VTQITTTTAGKAWWAKNERRVTRRGMPGWMPLGFKVCASLSTCPASPVLAHRLRKAALQLLLYEVHNKGNTTHHIPRRGCPRRCQHQVLPNGTAFLSTATVWLLCLNRCECTGMSIDVRSASTTCHMLSRHSTQRRMAWIQ